MQVMNILFLWGNTTVRHT